MSIIRVTVRTFQSVEHANMFVVMSEKVEQELLDLRPSANYIKVFHPILNDISIKDKITSKSSHRFADKKLILYFGLVRKYKGLEVLI